MRMSESIQNSLRCCSNQFLLIPNYWHDLFFFTFSLSLIFFLKPLPPNPTSNHSAAKQPAFSPSLPEHVYQNCFGGAGDWNSSLQCLSLKFENLWDAAVMKSWNPSVLLPESLPGEPSRYKRSPQANRSLKTLTCLALFVNR